jgi:hypothetical protein
LLHGEETGDEVPDDEPGDESKEDSCKYAHRVLFVRLLRLAVSVGKGSRECLCVEGSHRYMTM